MEQETVDNIRHNTTNLISTGDFESLHAFCKKANMDYKTVANLLADDFISNPTVRIVYKLSKALGVEPWMLMIKDFPFDQVKGRPLKTMSGPTYIIANAMEHADHNVQLLMMESASQTLRGINDKHSQKIKKAQASYLASNKESS